MESDKVLEIENLSTAFQIGGKPGAVTKDISFDIRRGEILGIVGESGSGKSVTAKTVMRLLPTPPSSVLSGTIALNGVELLNLSEREMEKIRGNKVAMIFQEPMTSLNPVMKIGTQVGESLKLHTDLDKETIRKRVVETLASVGLRNPETLIDQYPHEISGGMRQRVMIAMAIINHPDLIIADEPTTALDVTVQAQILNLLKKIHRDTGSSILFISHDLNVIKEVCQKVVVMYKGVIVERGDAKEVLKHPKHEYTRKLVASMPDQVKKSQNTKKLLEVSNLNVYYKENKKLFSSKNQRKHIIHNMSFDLYEGEILGVVGESGCGKSTLLRLIAGLLTPEKGLIKINGSYHPDNTSGIGYMLQKDHLLEWRTIYKNVLLGLEIRRELTAEKLAYVNQLLSDYGLDKFRSAHPSELSGGMRQRAALIRTLALKPELLLLDEPFSALDSQTRLSVSDDIGRILRQEKKTAILVTHDISEAISMADRVIILSPRPAIIRKIVPVCFDLENRTPMASRNAPEFKSYFNLIWKELNHDV